MSKFTIYGTRIHHFEIEIEAETEQEAFDLVSDYDGDDLEPHEVGVIWRFDTNPIA